MDWRLRGIPPALWRRVRDKAGDRLRDVLLGLLRMYADGEIDPLRPRAGAPADRPDEAEATTR